MSSPSSSTGEDEIASPVLPEVTSVIALPQYIVFFCILGLLAISTLTRISYILKIFIITGLAVAQCVLVYLSMADAFRFYHMINYDQLMHGKIDYVIILLTIVVALIIINRQVSFNLFCSEQITFNSGFSLS